jgi:L-ascorbate metabolism protein UlaG (beta-lactamase superfamily)
MRIQLDWLGCATFRLTIDDLVVFLDAYIDRVATAPSVGLVAADVRQADFILVGHSHFDHIAGAEVIALNTGARIIGSNESCRVMKTAGVPVGQLLPSQGGERHRLSKDVTVRVFPSLHACLWTGSGRDLGEARSGDVGLTEDQRAESMATRGRSGAAGAGLFDGSALAEHYRTATGSRRDGGPLVYLIETPAGTIFFQDTSGCWTGVLAEINADVAILAASGRANHNGEPYQGSLAAFISTETHLLSARSVVLAHHDNWRGVAEFVPIDVTPLRTELARLAPAVQLIETGYLAATPLLAG